jgi:phosphomannomutase
VTLRPAQDGTVVDDALAWIAQDPDPATRAELQALVDAGDTAALEDRFSGRLDFGTAGLRGELGAGPTRMNRVLVAQAAAGIAAYLLAREEHPTVVIGYDGRTNSAVFARDSAELFQGAGVAATLLPRELPTPVLAFAVRHLDASAGVMVTASHNPARDNGYKVYLGGADQGSQIVPPADAEIQAQIVRVAAGSIAELPRDDGYAIGAETIVDEYVRRTAALATHTGAPPYVYTAMHGVGWSTASAVFAAVGFPAPISVRVQQEPDPTFPTVAFPNPEEPGALDLAIATARDAGAQLIIANDPDADRLAVGIPDPGAETGWRRLTGNEVGWLLARWSAERRPFPGSAGMPAPGSVSDPGSAGGTLAASLVSSPALGELARQAGLDYVETLTGFKWISRVDGLIFGYEEALGYLVDPDKVRDKDGISAAVAVLDLAASLAAEGRTLADELLAFADAVGGYASGQVSIRVDELDEIGRMMTRLRAQSPAEVGGMRVESIDDFADGFGSFPPNDILRLHLAGGARVIVRPSGTEPKLKAYLDAWSTAGDGAERIERAQATLARLDAGVRGLLQVE